MTELSIDDDSWKLRYSAHETQREVLRNLENEMEEQCFPTIGAFLLKKKKKNDKKTKHPPVKLIICNHSVPDL